MEWLINNWYVIIAIVAGLAVIVAGIIAFFKLPLATQKEHIKQWLLWAVSAAERSLGGGTGQLKLREVYDKFITKFPFVSKLISFETFSNLVDEALEEMRDMLNKNNNISAIITPNKEDKT